MSNNRAPRIGVDLGGTKIEAILLTASGDISVRKRVATPKDNYRAILDSISALVDELCENLPVTERLPVGIGTPGSISRVSPLMRNANSTCLNGKPLLEDLQRTLARPVRLANDANCFTLSEASDGAAAGGETVFGIILGTGVGGGICVQGSVLQGVNGIAGEWGHNPLPPQAIALAASHKMPVERLCFCGKSNCIETWLSGPGLQATYLALQGTTLSAEQIAQSAASGDGPALACIHFYNQQLAMALATVINVFDPEFVVLGGGLSNIEHLYELLPGQLESWVFSDAVHTRIVKAQYGDSSGVRGAAWLWP